MPSWPVSRTMAPITGDRFFGSLSWKGITQDPRFRLALESLAESVG